MVFEDSYKVLHTLSGVIRNELDTKIVELVPGLTREKFNFAFYQAKSNSEISSWPDTRIGPIIGFNKSHLLLYLSDPTGEIPGSFVMIMNNLYYNERGLPLERQRDSYMYNYAADYYFTDRSLREILREFIKAKFKIYRTKEIVFAPKEAFLIKQEKSEEISLDGILT